MNKEKLDQILAQRAQVMERQIATVPGDVARIEASDRVELDLYHFSAFIAYFAGDEDILYWQNSPEGRKQAMVAWINVANGPYNPVDVVQVKDGVKSVVFTVPSVLNRDIIKPTVKRDGEPTIYSAVLNANHLMHMSTAYAEGYLRMKFADRYLRMQNPEVMIKNAEAWNKIFAFYGKPLLPTKAELAKATGVSQDITKDEVLGFDPL